MNLYLVLDRIPPFSSTRLDTTFSGTRLDPFSVLLGILPFFGIHRDSTHLRYSPGYYLSRCSPRPFFDPRTESLLRYSHRFYHSPVLDPILPFSSTRLDTTFPGTRLYTTFFRYWQGFYPSPVLARILPFSGTRPDSNVLRYLHEFYSSPTLAPILALFDTRMDTIFQGTRPDPFSVLAWILPFSGTGSNSTILWYSLGYYLSWYSPGPFFDTCTDSTLLR